MTTGRRLVGAAVLVAGITVVARVFGFGRWLVFSKTVGASCLADAYTTANQLPNVLFEVAVGGALAGAVIPVLAGPVERGDRAAQGRIVGALLTWSVLLLAPVALAAWLLADAYADAMLDGCPGSAATAARMLAIFVPQVFGYAVAVIATAVLQTHHRFAAGALAPLVSSAVVIATYLLFADRAPRPDGASRSAVDLLAWGTTLGVAALALTVLVPMLTLRLPVRPTLRLDPGVGRVLRRLALAGLAVLVAQQLALLMVTYLANHRGADGSVALYTWAYAIYLLPFAVLVQPVTTAVFPRLSARDESFDRLTATSTRAVLLAAGAGAAVLGAAAVPIAWVFAYDAGRVQEDKAYALADALMVLAPALIGFGALMHAGRVLYARHVGRPVAVVTVAAWLLTAVACVVATTRWDGVDVVPGLAAGMCAGMLAGGLAMLVVVRRLAGPAAVAGVARTVLVALFAAALAGFVGRIVASPVSDGGWQAGVLFTIVGGLAGLAAYGVLALLLAGREARQDVRMVLRRRSRA
ncbi:MAG: murein biosynthesis integral membrane protein MurJ [Kribbellaceae bacterium]